MCLVKKPKVVTPVEKDPAIITNPYLDGLTAVERARSGGVRSLTIPRGSSGTANTPVTTPQPSPTPTPTKGRLTDKQRNLATAWSSGNAASPFAKLGKLMLSQD